MEPAVASDGGSLRFAVGARVSCNMGREGWASGEIVATQYREDHWPPGKTAPYQVKLDLAFGGALIYAPADFPRVIRAELPSTFSIPEEDSNPERTLEVLHKEIIRLRDEPGVIHVSEPELMGVAEDGTELFVPRGDTGPWLVRVVIQGPKGPADSPQERRLRLQVKVNSAYPLTPPEVRIQSWLHHALVKQDGVVDEAAFAEALSKLEEDKSDDSASRLCRTMRAVLLLLGHPEQLSDIADMDDIQDAAEANAKCLKTISEYGSLRRHQFLFNEEEAFSKDMFDPRFWTAYAANTAEAWSSILTEEASEVYSFPIFTEGFCKDFVEELDSFHASGLPARRPNSMNNYGVVVNEIGMEPALDRLVHSLQLVAHHLFPGVGSHFDRHHTFVVRYKVGEDLGLDMHTDDSDVTFNICLGKDFKGAGLQFCGNQGAANHRHASLLYQHKLGHCVVHRGHRRHGADDITEGERLNLIVWTRNIEYRRSREWSRYNLQLQSSGYRQESGPPDKVCLSYTHDRDYGVFKEYKTQKMMQNCGRGWCPPRHAEYPDFLPEEAEPLHA